jgi:hypothetical protein
MIVRQRGNKIMPFKLIEVLLALGRFPSPYPV